VKDDRLEDIKFKTFGCGAAIAVSSMVSEMAMGKTLDEALKITPASVAEELKGLPKNKFHCSNLGAQALGKAIHNYLAKTGREKPAPEATAGAEHEHEGEEECHCPFCEADIADQSLPYCQACKAAIKFCSGCGKPVSPEAKTCPHCGSKING
jgi:nitrogen fixation NifU-like protein